VAQMEHILAFCTPHSESQRAIECGVWRCDGPTGVEAPTGVSATLLRNSFDGVAGRKVERSSSGYRSGGGA